MDFTVGVNFLYNNKYNNSDFKLATIPGFYEVELKAEDEFKNMFLFSIVASSVRKNELLQDIYKFVEIIINNGTWMDVDIDFVFDKYKLLNNNNLMEHECRSYYKFKYLKSQEHYNISFKYNNTLNDNITYNIHNNYSFKDKTSIKYQIYYSLSQLTDYLTVKDPNIMKKLSNFRK